MIALAVMAFVSTPALAVDQTYATAVQQARSLVKEGLAGRPDAAREAARVLEAGTGQTQAETLRDLRRTPPDLAGAESRLAAVAAALDRSGSVADPAAARRQLHGILAQPRYDSLHQGESLWDRAWNWVLTNLLAWLAQITFGSLPAWQWLLILLAVLLATTGVTVAIVRTSWSRAKSVYQAPVPTSRPAAGAGDRFALADLAADAGDFAGATRHLVAAVATAVSGRPFWESSPLTVRELFRQAGRLGQLGPLVGQFESAVYGGRPVGADDYRRLADLAAPFRTKSDREIAA